MTDDRLEVQRVYVRATLLGPWLIPDTPAGRRLSRELPPAPDLPAGRAWPVLALLTLVAAALSAALTYLSLTLTGSARPVGPYALSSALLTCTALAVLCVQWRRRSIRLLVATDCAAPLPEEARSLHPRPGLRHRVGSTLWMHALPPVDGVPALVLLWQAVRQGQASAAVAAIRAELDQWRAR